MFVINTVYVMHVHFTGCKQSIIHQKIIKFIVKDNAFLLFVGFQNVNESEFHEFWKFGYLALEKFWNCF